MNERDLDIMRLQLAQNYANTMSDCRKVKVGSVIVDEEQLFFGSNTVIPGICNGVDCNRVLPHDGLPHCVSTIHSEVEAIIRARRNLAGAEIFVTRYPCEGCARAIVTAGIDRVVYGRVNPISEDTARIFAESDIEVVHYPEFNPPEGE